MVCQESYYKNVTFLLVVTQLWPPSHVPWALVMGKGERAT